MSAVNLRATYKSGLVIERESASSFGLVLPLPDRRPILIELSGKAQPSQIKHAQMTVDISDGKVITNANFVEVV